MKVTNFFAARIAAGLTIIAFSINVGRAQEEKIPCPWQSQTPPDALQGQEGSSTTDTYWFTHISDVDQVQSLQKFVCDIYNNHPNTYLPAEWVQADGTVRVRFHDIEPGGCGFSSYSSTALSKVDSDAYINYGSAKQFKKANAALYVQQAKPNGQSPLAVGLLLRSKMAADLKLEGGTPEHLDLEFDPSSDGKSFTYTVINRGNSTLLFSIPSLT